MEETFFGVSAQYVLLSTGFELATVKQGKYDTFYFFSMPSSNAKLMSIDHDVLLLGFSCSIIKWAL